MTDFLQPETKMNVLLRIKLIVVFIIIAVFLVPPNTFAGKKFIDYDQKATPEGTDIVLISEAGAGTYYETLSSMAGTVFNAYNANLTTWGTIAPSANVQSFNSALTYGVMKTLLGLVIGTDVQAYNANLTTWATLAPSANMKSLSVMTYAQMQAALSVDDLITLSGVAEGSAHLGTFTGSTIADSVTFKAALQAIETALELRLVITDINTAAKLETVANLGAYASDMLAATSEANFKSITNLEVGTDYNAYSAALNSISGLTEADVSIIEATADNTYNVVTSGGNLYVLRSNSDNSALEFAAPTGTGSPANATSPTLVTPILGTPTSGTLTNCTGLPVAGLSDVNAGTDPTADLEEETHASEHAPNGADPVATWSWGSGLEAGDATPPVKNGYLYDLGTPTTITITDFYGISHDDHTEFVDGDRIGIFMHNPAVTLGCSTGPIECNSGTDFKGHASQITPVIFIYASGAWYSPNLVTGMSDALTLSAKVGRNYNTFTGNDTMTDAEAYNHTHYVTSAAEIELPAVGAYHSWSIRNHTADDVNLDPNGSEVIRLNGVALDAGDSIVGTDVGDKCDCGYFSAGVIACDCTGYEDAGD